MHFFRIGASFKRLNSRIELKYLAGDVGGALEKDDETGRFFDGVKPFQGVFPFCCLLHGVGEGGGHAGFEEAGEDTVAPDVPFPEFEGVAFGQADEPGFRSGVGGLAERWSDR